MSNIGNGGDAFPIPGLHKDCKLDDMTLRDYFAANADISAYMPLETFTSKNGRRPDIGEFAEYIATIRMIEADAMLKARCQQ